MPEVTEAIGVTVQMAQSAYVDQGSSSKTTFVILPLVMLINIILLIIFMVIQILYTRAKHEKTFYGYLGFGMQVFVSIIVIVYFTYRVSTVCSKCIRHFLQIDDLPVSVAQSRFIPLFGALIDKGLYCRCRTIYTIVYGR